MYQWRKFEFFEEKYARRCTTPEDVTGKIECCSSGRGRVVIGCDDGTVSLLDLALSSIMALKLTPPPFSFLGSSSNATSW